jgi:ABC-type glycerol-3-phosphate transport system substrate-binding protein
MNKSSSFQIALLSAFAGLAVAGVLIFSFFVSQNSSTAVGPVTIWGTFDEGTVQRTLSDLVATYPDLQTVAYVQQDASAYASLLTNAFASGDAPDLFFLTEDQAYAQKSRVIMIAPENLSASQFNNTFIDAGTPFLESEGAIALPVLADPIVMYWNKDILAAAGYAKPPEQWDEIYEFAQRVTKRTDVGSVDISAIAFGGYSNVDHAKELLGMLIAQAGGSPTGRDAGGRPISTLLAKGTGAAVQPTALALAFYTRFADPANADYSWNRSIAAASRTFTAGTLALYFGLASEEAQIRAANPNLNFGISRVPQTRRVGATPSIVATAGQVYGVALPKAAKNPAGARVIQWLLATGEISAAFSTSLGLPSARRDVLNAQLATQKPGVELSNQALASLGAGIMRSWTDPDPARTSEIFRAMIEDTTSGNLLLSEAISRADQQINNIVGI